jgi:hypothetical protein
LGVYGDEKREFPDDQTPGTEMTNPYDLHSVASPMTEASNPTDVVIVEAQGRQVFEMAGKCTEKNNPIPLSYQVSTVS